MSKFQYYGIKFPFTAENFEKYYVDLNMSGLSYVKSQIMHALFTVKGSKLRDPLYGTNLIKYIFDPNDDNTWSAIQNECNSAINQYVKGCSLDEISIMQSDDDLREIYVKIKFTSNINGTSTKDAIVTKV